MYLTALPDDVLFEVFSYLPLRGVLYLEHLCRRLQLAVSGYLCTLKALNLYSKATTRDIFRSYHEKVFESSVLEKLLDRCKLVRSIVYIPAPVQVKRTVGIIAGFDNVRCIDFVDSWDLFEEIRAQNVRVVLNEVCVSSAGLCNLTSTLSSACHTYRHVRILSVEGITMDSQTLLYFSDCIEMCLTKCNFEMKSNSELDPLKFRNLSKFIYTEQPGRSASSRVGVTLIRKATESEKLKVLHMGLSEFTALETAASCWKALFLEDLQVVSTGSYSASLQQLKYASIVAHVCHLCRATLEKISLPSSILIKRFFTQLISSNSHLQQLKTLRMTGLADTKMFLSPGNLVETFYYQEFFKLCPMISSLSLHSFTGSLLTLTLPLTLTELTLPWDNRLNLERQRNEISSTLSIVPHLLSLSILGVEEVDAVLGRRFGQPPILDITIQSLKEFRLANACVQAVVLRECTNLAFLSIQCCPELQEINIPVQSLKKICIYDDYHNYIARFINFFMASRGKCSVEPTCHIHLQLHSVLNQEADIAQVKHHSKMSHLFSVVEQACTTSKDALDILVLKDNQMHLFEHNSGEHMYPFTEFQTQAEFASGRSDEEVRTEMSRREQLFEGLKRWGECLLDVKALLKTGLKQSCAEILTADVRYCEGSFKCASNLTYLWKLNSSSCVCQPSGSMDPKEARSFHAGNACTALNVPHIQPHIQSLMEPPSDYKHWNVTINPLIIVSMIEYAHNIYTLFYYD